jgi:lipoprotein-releasing system permease protein
MIWGNLIGVGLCLFQSFTGILTLDPDTYYLSTVPVYATLPSAIWILLLLNACCFAVSVLMLVGPSYLITKINPAKAIKFE